MVVCVPVLVCSGDAWLGLRICPACVLCCGGGGVETDRKIIFNCRKEENEVGEDKRSPVAVVDGSNPCPRCRWKQSMPSFVQI